MSLVLGKSKYSNSYDEDQEEDKSKILHPKGGVKQK